MTKHSPDSDAAPQEMSIGELADHAEVTRRVVRFYVQRGLIPAPSGKGRGSFYTPVHLHLISKIQALQAAGHSLEGITNLLSIGEKATPLSENDETESPIINALVAPPEDPLSASSIKPKKLLSAPRHVQRRAQTQLNVSLWTRVAVMPGVELNIDASKHQFDKDELQQLKETFINAVSEIEDHRNINKNNRKGNRT